MGYKKLVTGVESHASTVSLLQSGEWRYIKEINKQATKQQTFFEIVSVHSFNGT